MVSESPAFVNSPKDFSSKKGCELRANQRLHHSSLPKAQNAISRRDKKTHPACCDALGWQGLGVSTWDGVETGPLGGYNNGDLGLRRGR